MIKFHEGWPFLLKLTIKQSKLHFNTEPVKLDSNLDRGS